MGKITEKLLSGRFILTIIVGVILLRAVWVDITYVEKFTDIILVVVYAYFNRSDRKE